MLAAEVKACCAASYSNPAVRFLLGDSFHPGGAALTRRLLTALEVDASAVILDIASGPGTSAILAAEQLGCSVIGVELSSENVAAARSAASRAGVSERVSFVEGDAEALPLDDASVDGALCECAFCLFPDKPVAAAELARVLRPGSRVALSDVVAATERLPEELSGMAAWVACVADARPLTELAALLEDAGLEIEHAEEQPALIEDLVSRVEARLRLARLVQPEFAGDLGPAIERGLELVPLVREAVRDGVLGYGIVIARR